MAGNHSDVILIDSDTEEDEEVVQPAAAGVAPAATTAPAAGPNAAAAQGDNVNNLRARLKAVETELTSVRLIKVLMQHQRPGTPRSSYAKACAPTALHRWSVRSASS